MTQKTTRERLDAELDKTLLDIIKNGVPLIHPKTGEPILDKDDKPVMVPPSHQNLEVARKRLSDLGLTKEPKEGSDAARLADKYNSNPDSLEMNGVPEFIAEPSEEPETAVG